MSYRSIEGMMGAPLGEQPKLRTYRRIAELGRGGMANVYLAAMRGPHGFTKLVVMKELKSELAVDREFHLMFMDEARLAARLNHPNIVQTYEVSDEQGGPVIVMEYLEGQPLHRIWSSVSRKEMPLAAQLYVVSNVLQGLEYANALKDFDGTPLNVVHRDISPHNIFITYSGEVKIVDFGIAKASDSSFKTEVGTLKGKLAYMPPEQAQGENVDQRADIFSVGVVLWEAAVGRRLWKGLKDVAILHHLLSGTIPSPRSLNDQVSERLEAVIMKALALDRDKRYATAAEFQKDIDALIDEMPERFHRRELGTVISDAFVDERTRISNAIEDQLKLARVVATGEIQTVDLAAQMLSNSSGNFSMAPPPVLIPMAPPSVPSMAQMMVSPLAYPHMPGDSSSIRPPMAMPVPSPPPKRSPLTAVVLGALAVLLPAGAFATFKAVQMVPSTTTTSSTRSATVATATPSAIPTTDLAPTSSGAIGTVGTGGAIDFIPGKTRIVVRTRPSDAVLFLDGEKVTLEGPLVTDDHGTHRLRVERAGFVTKELSITFDKDRAVDVALDPKRGAGPAPATTGARTATTAATTAPTGKDPETPDLGY